MQKAIITCAPSDSVSTEDLPDDPPHSPEAIASEAAAAVSAGAAIVRLHARDEQGEPMAEASILRRTIRMLRERADCLIEAATTVSWQASFDERAASLAVKPDIAALPCGSVNLGDETLIQGERDLAFLLEAAQEAAGCLNLICYHHGHIATIKRFIDEERLDQDKPHYFTCVLGATGGAPGDARTLLHMVDSLPRGAIWVAAGIGKAARAVIPAALTIGGHVRVGFEDQIRLRSGSEKPRNADLVDFAVSVAREIGRDIAAPPAARAILGI